MFEFKTQDIDEEEQKNRIINILEVVLGSLNSMDEAGSALKDALCELPGSDARINKLKQFYKHHLGVDWKGPDIDGAWAGDEITLVYLGPLDCIWLPC